MSKTITGAPLLAPRRVLVLTTVLVIMSIAWQKSSQAAKIFRKRLAIRMLYVRMARQR